MLVLVTGATGFIGTHVIPELLARGHRVRALLRPGYRGDTPHPGHRGDTPHPGHRGDTPHPGSDGAGVHADVEVVRAELVDSRAATDGIDAVIHLAGVAGGILRGDERQSALWQTNVAGTRSLFAAAADGGVRRGVIVTAAWTALRPDLAARSAYVASRIASEELAFATPRAEICAVCPTFVVGAGDRGPNLPGALVLAFLRGRLPLAPPGGATWIAAEDAARAIAEALERGEPRTRYVIGAEHHEHRALLTRLAALTGRRPPWASAPRPVLTAASALIDNAMHLVGLRHALPLRIGIDLLALEEPIDCTASHRALGAPRVAIDDALAAAVEWFHARGYV